MRHCTGPSHGIAAICAAITFCLPCAAQGTVVVDTGQNGFYDAVGSVISAPAPGEAFFGQDAQHGGRPAAYQDNADGTISDLNTGLMWVKDPDLVNKSTFVQAVAGAAVCSVGGYSDWRLPTIKELYSLIDFNGSSFALVPYIDTTYFGFRFGNTALGERVIDAQYWSSTQYVGTTMNNDPTVFGVNFADGRIKGYPRDTGIGGLPMQQFVRYVRGPLTYGQNQYVDNGDGTISDLATGLMWMKADSTTTMNWQQALTYAENLTLAGQDDWRLPNAKELQSIVDYTRAPDATNPAQQGPAIDPIFTIQQNESWCWTGTTHLDGPVADAAVYVCFGQAFGYLGPAGSGNWVNVHGAGAQRSDPKAGNPSNWPYGRGPQGDEIRIYNYVRCVRQLPGWTNLGNGLSGANGEPELVGIGDLTSGAGLTLSLGNALANTPTLLVFSVAQAPTPLLGGTLVPDPAAPGWSILLYADGTGAVDFQAVWPQWVGFTGYFQSWVLDPAGPFGVAVSNAVTGTIL